jgi:hypothetical protein
VKEAILPGSIAPSSSRAGCVRLFFKNSPNRLFLALVWLIGECEDATIGATADDILGASKTVVREAALKAMYTCPQTRRTWSRDDLQEGCYLNTLAIGRAGGGGEARKRGRRVRR